MPPILLLTAAFAVLMTASAYGLLRMSRYSDAVALRLRVTRAHAVHAGTGNARLQARAAPVAGAKLPLRMIAAVGGGILRSGLMSGATLAALEQTLATSGLRSAGALPLFIGSKIVLMAALPLLAWMAAIQFAPDTPFVYAGPVLSGAVGMLLPDKLIRSIRQRYIARVEQGVPDVLDMMVICARSGLPLEAALGRVGEEIARARPEIANELAAAAAEMHVVVDVRIALDNLATRTGLESLKRLAVTLTQTLEYGTPLADALRTLSAEMRAEVLIRAEERAARLPVMLTLPMILFILPCQFIVAGGPALLRISKAF